MTLSLIASGLLGTPSDFRVSPIDSVPNEHVTVGVAAIDLAPRRIRVHPSVGILASRRIHGLARDLFSLQSALEDEPEPQPVQPPRQHYLK
jgi:hypothetical protein